MVQLYVEFPANTGYGMPVRQLRGLEKVDLAAGEETVEVLEVTRKALSVWIVSHPLSFLFFPAKCGVIALL